MADIYNTMIEMLQSYVNEGYEKDDILMYVGEEAQVGLETDEDMAEADRAVRDFHNQQGWTIEF